MSRTYEDTKFVPRYLIESVFDVFQGRSGGFYVSDELFVYFEIYFIAYKWFFFSSLRFGIFGHYIVKIVLPLACAET